MADTLAAETRISLVQPARTKHLCTVCLERWKTSWRQAGTAPKVVVVNVFEGGKWVRIEAFHRECYEKAGSPHGAID